jgi:hypothetical protein
MANVDTPFGLKPVRYRNGSPYNGAVVPMYLAATYANNMFIGDSVVKVAGGSNASPVTVPGAGSFNIGTLPNIELSGVADASPITGVIVGFAASPTALENQYRVASTERVVYVCNDPNVVFEIQADGAIPALSVGLNAIMIRTHSGSTASGLSGMELDTTGTAPSADASNILMILQAVNREDVDTTLTHAKVEVIINTHTESSNYTAATDGTLGI